MQSEIDAIVRAIHVAFEGVPRGEITLHEAEVIDGYGTVAERERARRRDTETSWQQVSDSAVVECRNALNHLDAQSWCHYLPRYMEWSLRHRGDVVDHTIYSLLLSGDRELNEHRRRRHRMLTAEQSAVVGAFLVHMSKRTRDCDAAAAAEALTQHWGRFGTE